MSNNVILLGAGASFDAGIPLLGSFMDRIFELANIRRSPTRDLTKEELEILQEVIEIRDSMERYQPRVAINQFNLEQVLSILSFEALVGVEGGEQKLEAFKKAISLTIELTCSVTHHGKLNTIHEDGPEVYRNFWDSLLTLHHNRLDELPTILSFNYDLVLERALFQLAVGKHIGGRKPKVRGKGFNLNYHHPACAPAAFSLKPGRYRGDGAGFDEVPGTFLEAFLDYDEATSEFIEISLLKLHGSLNFSENEEPTPWSPLKIATVPQIIPPVFNKANATFGTPIWKAGLDALRTCKNLIICGYSLPTTDSYMQYFLKAALGPNRNLNQIFVFDPLLFQDPANQAGEELKQRYSECFAPQMHGKIIFQPNTPRTRGKVVVKDASNPQTHPGTFAHMVELFTKDPEAILFGVRPEAESEEQSYHQPRPVAIRRTRRNQYDGL